MLVQDDLTRWLYLFLEKESIMEIVLKFVVLNTVTCLFV